MLQRLEMERRKRETMGISELLKIIPVVDQSIVKSITDTRQEQWKSRKSERRLRDRITMNLKDITDILKDSPHFGNFYETEIDLKTT